MGGTMTAESVEYVYELDTVTGGYVHAGMHRDRIEAYPVDIDLTAIDNL
jgi:hypothetical protein